MEVKQRKKVVSKIAWSSTLLSMLPGDIIEQTGIDEYKSFTRMATHLKKTNRGKWIVNTLKGTTARFVITRVL